MERIISTRNIMPQSMLTKALGKTIKQRAAAYCRVSTLDEEQELSFESQCNYYRTFINKNKDMVLVDIYSDHGISGLKSETRPGFMKMLEDVKKDLIDVIYVKSISRFSRNAIECREAVNILNRHNVKILFEQEGIWSNNPQFDLVLGLLSAAAQEESNSKSQIVAWALDKFNERGTPARACSYGYRKLKGPQREWEIDENAAKRVRYGFKMCVKLGTTRGLVKIMNNYDATHEGGRYWDRRIVMNMLENETYIGDIKTNKYCTIDYITGKQAKNNGRKTQYYIEGHHQPIISKELFYKVQRILEEEKETWKKSLKNNQN